MSEPHNGHIPPATWDARTDPDKALLLCSGSVDSILKAGGLPISISITETTLLVEESSILNPLIAENFMLTGRRIYLAFGKLPPSLRIPVVRLGILLLKNGADVRILTWPWNHGETLGAALTSQKGKGTPSQRLMFYCGDSDRSLELRRILVKSDLEQVELELLRAKLKAPLLEQLCRDFARPLGVSAQTLKTDITEDEQFRFMANQVAAMEVEAWEIPVVGLELFSELVAVINRHILIGSDQLTTVVLWTAMTHLVDDDQAIDILPILHVRSATKRCGKTTLLRLIQDFAHRGLSSNNITGAAIFRVVELFRPTLLMDEVDTWLSRNSDAIGILNSGHTKDDAFVFRSHGPGIIRYRTWCPKLLSSIGRLSEFAARVEALTDRTIGIELHQRLNTDRELDRLFNSKKENPEQFIRLRRQLKRWIIDNVDSIKDHRPELPPGLNDREIDNWRTMLAIADTVGGPWPNAARDAAVALSTGDNSPDSELLLLLSAIRRAFNARSGTTFLATNDLLPIINAQNGEQPLTREKLASILKPLGVKPRQRWDGDGKTQVRGYALADLEPVFRSHLV